MEGDDILVRIVYSLLIFHCLVNAAIYYAYFPYETDTILTAWLIKKFQDSKAKFAGLQRGEAHRFPPKFQINTSISPYRRTARYTAFESAVKILNVKDKCVKKLIKVSRVLETASWRKQQFPNILVLERKIHNVLPKNPKPNDFRKAFEIIDNYCRKD